MRRSRRIWLRAAALVGAGLAVLVACGPPGPLTVTLIADGETRTLTTDVATVGDLLAQAGIRLDEDDRVTPPENTFLSNGATVRVIRVEVRTETEQRVIPYGRETVRDVTVPVGETRLLRAGVNGIEEVTYAITLEDGVEVERRVVRRTLLQEPRNEVILIGAREEITAVPISGTVAYLSAHNAWVMRTDTGNVRRLTSTGDLDGRVFDLSPDGSWLLFTRSATETGTLNTLWMVDTTTADAEPVRLNAEDVLWAGWAPDGERIAFSTGEVREGAPGWQAANDLYLAAPRASDGLLLGRREVLGPSSGGTYGWWGTTYSWGPTDDLMAYARAEEVGIVDLFAGKTVPLLRFAPYRTRGPWAWVPSVDWAPDGQVLVTVSHGPSPTGEAPEDSPVFDVYALTLPSVESRDRVASTAPPPVQVELASEVGMWAAPNFSPDGNWILFGRARVPYTSQTSTYDLYIMDRDGSDRRLLFPADPREPGLEYPAVAWDPAGGRFLAIYQGDLYLVSLDGQARPVTDDGAITAVRWAGGGE